MINAEIVADSVNPDGMRITTFVLTYPRFIHSEIMTHRKASRNSASSRAIPSKKIISDVINNPAMPIHWGQLQKGMAADTELSPSKIFLCKLLWTATRYFNIMILFLLNKLGLHKQVANRLLEPWFHMKVVFTATNFGNFFNLRVSKHAQPEFKYLAREMLLRYIESKPRRLDWGEWHIPFGDKYLQDISEEDAIKVGVARCARVSYNNFEGDIDYQKDYNLHNSLINNGHFSPCEHVAQAVEPESVDRTDWGNFDPGWLQYRKLLPGENQTEFDPVQLLKNLEA